MMGKMEREILCLKIANDGVSEKGYILHSLLTLGFCDAQHKCRRYSVYYGVREGNIKLLLLLIELESKII